MLTRALLAGFLLAVSGCASLPPEVLAKRSVAVLDLTEGGTCSGTLVGPSTLLSASHCFEGSDLLSVNMVPVNVLSIRHDGSDHALVTVDHVFPHYAPVGSEPIQRQELFMFGNPAGRRDMYRRGYVMGRDDRTIYLDIMIGHGDSGAGIFNDRGEVVGVVTGYGKQAEFVPGIILPFESEFFGLISGSAAP